MLEGAGEGLVATHPAESRFPIVFAELLPPPNLVTTICWVLWAAYPAGTGSVVNPLHHATKQPPRQMILRWDALYGHMTRARSANAMLGVVRPSGLPYTQLDNFRAALHA